MKKEIKQLTKDYILAWDNLENALIKLQNDKCVDECNCDSCEFVELGTNKICLNCGGIVDK